MPAILVWHSLFFSAKWTALGGVTVGLVRVFLALAVVLSHSYPTGFGGGIIAVQIFFIISGFFISYILVEVRNYSSVRNFYENRALRLFPIYWFVAICTLGMYSAGWALTGNPPPFFEVYQSLDLSGQLALAVSNVTLIGQDWIMFTGIEDGRITFMEDWRNSEVRTWHGLLVPPAWSLGVELTFYLIAPFILPRLRLVIFFLALSLALRVYLISIGLENRPWTYRFFPTELALFLVGALSHQLWMRFLNTRGWLNEHSSLWVSVAAILLVLIAATLHIWTPYIPTLIFVALALPFLFRFQKYWGWDRWIGELSYPIYIVHMSILFPVNFVWGRLSDDPGYQGLDETALVLVLTLIASLALKLWIADPVERVRDTIREAPDASVVVQKL